MGRQKRLAQVSGALRLHARPPVPVAGYEIHMGVSKARRWRGPAFTIDGRPEGACSDDGQILGTYLHGVFDTASACGALLGWAGLRSDRAPDTAALREASLDRIADATRPLLDALLTRGLIK